MSTVEKSLRMVIEKWFTQPQCHAFACRDLVERG